MCITEFNAIFHEEWILWYKFIFNYRKGFSAEQPQAVLDYEHEYNVISCYFLQLSLKSRALDVAPGVFKAYDAILHA
jgi:hypothetical protein